MNVQITKAVLEDLGKILNLNHKLFLYETSFTNTYDINWSLSEKEKKYFSQRIEDSENGIVLIAKDGHKIMGFH